MEKLLNTKKPADRWELIKAALRARGSSLSAVARAVGVTRHAAHHVQHKAYPAIEAEIARVLGVSPAHLWPGRYNADGTPKRQRPNAPLAQPALRGPRKSSRVPGASNAEEVA